MSVLPRLSRGDRGRWSTVAAGLVALALRFGGAMPLTAQTQVAAATVPPNQPVFAIVPASIELGAIPVRVELTVTGAPPSTGFSVDVLFDPGQVAVTGIELGEWAGSTGRPVQPLGPNLDEPGRLVLGALMVGEAPAPEGDGVLAVLTLAGVGSGTSNLTLAKPLLVRVGAGSEPVAAIGEGAEVVVADVPQAAATLAVAAAATLAAAPVAGLVPGFVAAVEAEATSGAPRLGTVVATALATFTPGAVPATPPAPFGETAAPSSNTGRNLILAAVLFGAIAFLWIWARRSSPL